VWRPPIFHLQSVARRTLLGGESRNPSIAAASMLGRGSVKLGERMARRATKRRGRRSFHRGNPVPALVGLLGGLGGKLGKRLKGKAQKQAERQAAADALGQRALLGDSVALKALHGMASGAATREAKDYAAGILAQVVAALREESEMKAGSRAAGAAAARREEQAVTTQRLNIFGAAAGQIGQALARAPKGRLLGGLRGAGQVAGRASSVAGTAGAGASLAGAGAAATAAVVIGGLAVGALIGTGLRLAFGTARAVRAEEAAVEANLAVRRARGEVEQRLGRKVNAAEARAMFDAAAAHLQELGFVQQANGQWHRPRSAVERLLG